MDSYKEVNKYFTFIILGAITFLNSDLYYGKLSEVDNNDLITGINFVTKILLIITVLLLITMIPFSETKIPCLFKVILFIIFLIPALRKKYKDKSNVKQVENSLILISNIAYSIFFFALIFFIILL